LALSRPAATALGHCGRAQSEVLPLTVDFHHSAVVADLNELDAIDGLSDAKRFHLAANDQ
jgi:hypothetical protein